MPSSTISDYENAAAEAITILRDEYSIIAQQRFDEKQGYHVIVPQGSNPPKIIEVQGKAGSPAFPINVYEK